MVNIAIQMFVLNALALHFGKSKADMFPAPRVTTTRESTLACYWETYLYPEFSSANIDIKLCNHLIYDDARLNKETWKLDHKNKTIDIDLGGFKNVTELKIANPILRVEIAAGMWRTPKEYFDMIADSTKRDSFVQSVVDFVVKNNFDGFHLHWGSPASPEVDLDQAPRQLTIFLQHLHLALKRVEKTLSIAIWSPLVSNLKNFELPQLYRNVDLVFPMTFGYSGRWFRNTGAFAPLYPGESSKLDEKYLTVDASWKEIKRKVLLGPIEADEANLLLSKTVLVVSPKGNSFELKDPEEHGMGAASLQNVVPEIGAQPKFNEICSLMKVSGNNWTRVWDAKRKVLYMFKKNKIIYGLINITVPIFVSLLLLFATCRCLTCSRRSSGSATRTSSQ